jgi:uncharacterized protein (TIGR02145 family)
MKYLFLLFSVFAFGQEPNEMVSFTQAASLGFILKPGQSHVTSNRCMTKLEALTKYKLSISAMDAYANNQLIPRSVWLDGRCIVKVSSTEFKEFMCYNLGADETFDPHIPIQAIHGNYYQWGRSTVVANASTPPTAIAGWNTTLAPDGSWSDVSKTINDPCPPGYRVPTLDQWTGVRVYNTLTATGSFVNSPTNFGSAVHFGPNATVKSLTFPTSGFRSDSNGTLFNRGSNGYYHSSTLFTGGGTNVMVLILNQNSSVTTITERQTGFPVRCISL